MPTFEEQFTVAAPVEAVWAFVTDPRRVGACVPGATGVEVVDERTFRLGLAVKVGFLGTRQEVEVRITETDPPRRLVSVGRGEDRRLGSQVDVRSTVDLAPAGAGGTEVRYRSEVKVVGRLGTIGDAVMRLKARELAGEFAARMRAALEAPGPAAAAPAGERGGEG